MPFLLIVLWFSFYQVSTTTTPDFQPLFDGETIASDAIGIWQSRGYGWVVTVSETSMQLYDYSDAGCVKDPSTTEELAFLAAYFAREGSQLRVTARREGATIYPFEEINALPAVCEQVVENTPKNVFDNFWSIMDRHYAFFDAYNVDWEARRDEFAPRCLAI